MKDFREEFKDFQADTEWDIKKRMQQMMDLRQDVETVNTRVSELENRVSELENTITFTVTSLR